MAGSSLRRGDVVLVEAGDFIAADGEVIEGVGSVDESAIAGESAPVIREAGGDFSSVTGGTRLLSDWLVVRVTANPGETFLDRMIGMVEAARRQKTPNEIALAILLAGLTLIFLYATVTLLPYSIYSVDAAKAEVVLRAPRSGRIRVAVTDANGVPVLGARVSCRGVPEFLGSGYASFLDATPPTGSDGLTTVSSLGPGAYELVAPLADALDTLEHDTGLSIDIHVDGASGAFLAPFCAPELEWDFRLPRVKSISTSGHKFGLAPLGVGWIVWRDVAELDDWT